MKKTEEKKNVTKKAGFEEKKEKPSFDIEMEMMFGNCSIRGFQQK